jgi:hypothetical protein
VMHWIELQIGAHMYCVINAGQVVRIAPLLNGHHKSFLTFVNGTTLTTPHTYAELTKMLTGWSAPSEEK